MYGSAVGAIVGDDGYMCRDDETCACSRDFLDERLVGMHEVRDFAHAAALSSERAMHGETEAQVHKLSH